jgi:DHA1 family bicyclomycin/chloramphenicol resistance-like MFS transporter
VFSALALALVALRFRETLPAPNSRALQPREMLRIWARIARHPTFWAWALLAATSYGGLFTFLATSSFVFITVLGLSKTQYGLLMLSMSAVYIAGTVL